VADLAAGGRLESIGDRVAAWLAWRTYVMAQRVIRRQITHRSRKAARRGMAWREKAELST